MGSYGSEKSFGFRSMISNLASAFQYLPNPHKLTMFASNQNEWTVVQQQKYMASDIT